jgi:hypothetical protein
MVTREQAKAFFNTGDVPSEEDFQDFIDSLSWKNEIDIRDFDVDPTFSNDSASGLQAAINELSALKVGTLIIDNGHYAVGNSLITSLDSVNPNCQLYAPLKLKSDSEVSCLTIKGRHLMSTTTEGVESVPRNTKGVILESTILGSGTRPSIFATPHANAGVTGNRNYMHMRFENMIFRARTKTSGTHIVGTMSALNLENFLTCSLKDIKCDVSSPLVDIVEPTTLTYGIYLPSVNCQGQISLEGEVHVEGYQVGLMLCEHMKANAVRVYGNIVGIILPSMSHACSIDMLSSELNAVQIKTIGSGYLKIGLMSSEHYIPGYPGSVITENKWWDFVYSIWKSGGSAENITICLNSIGISGLGKSVNDADFVTAGSPNYKILSGLGENI